MMKGKVTLNLKLYIISEKYINISSYFMHTLVWSSLWEILSIFTLVATISFIYNLFCFTFICHHINLLQNKIMIQLSQFFFPKCCLLWQRKNIIIINLLLNLKTFAAWTFDLPNQLIFHHVNLYLWSCLFLTCRLVCFTY